MDVSDGATVCSNVEHAPDSQDSRSITLIHNFHEKNTAGDNRKEN